MMSLIGVVIAPAKRSMGLKKRKHCIVIGKTYYLHPKLYKRLCRRGADITRLLEGVKVKYKMREFDFSWFDWRPDFKPTRFL